MLGSGRLRCAVVPEATRPYNPLDRVELGKSVERALLAGPLMPLPPAERFPGAGLYAIYYVGDFAPYAGLAPPARMEGEIPIYVGRARPRGARRGTVEGLEATTSEPVLYNRLRQHAISISQIHEQVASSGVGNLRLTDFRCRYLVADDIWVPLGEALLIGHYRPVWNVIIDGFGNHAPGSGRERQARSPWDELHPGRSWAAKLPPSRSSAAEIAGWVAEHLESMEQPDLDSVPDLGGVVQTLIEEAAQDPTSGDDTLPG